MAPVTTRSQVKSHKKTTFMFQKRNFYFYHCGPIAIFNLLTRLNIFTTFKHVLGMGIPIQPCGINANGLDVFVKNINSKYNLNITKHPGDYKLIKSKLSEGNIGILLFCEDPKVYYGHFALVEKYSTNSFVFINYSNDCEINIVNKKTLEKLVKHKEEFGDTVFWSCKAN